MKKQLLAACFFAVALGLKGDDAPTLDVVAGWGWSPFPCYGYDPYWRAYPAVGVGVLPYRCGSYYPYGQYGYAPFWGYEAGVRIPLNDKRHAPALSEGLLRPLPGSAPTDPRDPQHERLWDRDIETLLRAPAAEQRPTAATNAPGTQTPH